MTRIGSQLTFFSPQRILSRMVVERNEHNFITGIYSLDDKLVEMAQTSFFDGIISTEIVSLKQNISIEKIQKLAIDFTYLDLSEEFPIYEIEKNHKPMLLDFGLNSFDQINIKLENLAQKKANLPIYELIASCVYYPSLLLGSEAELVLNRCTGLLLWEKIDLVNKLFTNNSTIRKI